MLIYFVTLVPLVLRLLTNTVHIFLIILLPTWAVFNYIYTIKICQKHTFQLRDIAPTTQFVSSNTFLILCFLSFSFFLKKLRGLKKCPVHLPTHHSQSDPHNRPFWLACKLTISDHMIAEWPIKENHFRSHDLKWVILHTG